MKLERLTNLINEVHGDPDDAYVNTYIEVFGEGESYGVVGPFQNENSAREWVRTVNQQHNAGIVRVKQSGVLTPEQFIETLADDEEPF